MSTLVCHELSLSTTYFSYQLKDGDIGLMYLSKNLSTFFLGGRIPLCLLEVKYEAGCQKKSVQSSITQSSPVSVQHHSNFVQDIHPSDK